MKIPTLGITLRAALLSWSVTLATLLIFVIVILPWQRRTFLEHLESKAHGVTVSLRGVAAGAAVNEDYSTVVEYCNEVLQGDDSLAYIVFEKNDGFSLIHERAGWRSETKADPEWQPEKRAPSGGIRYVSSFQRRVFHYSQPFDYSGIEWGWIHVGVSLEAYDRGVAGLYWITGSLGIVCVALSLFASLGHARRMVRPILDLRATVQRVAGGDLSARAATDRQDELGSLATSINSMTEAILLRDRTLHEANLRLEERVEERTRELREQMAHLDRAHQQLVKTERQLLEASRLAGMAQVATGVLHNVGNVLNSVNVSANMLHDELIANRSVSILKQTADLLRDQSENVHRFLSEDPRARLLPRLIIELADDMIASRARIALEFTSFGENIEHIKQIVAAQQTFAKAGGVHQTFDPAELFSDALRLMGASIQRHGVAITTDYQHERASLCTDRHLALQILVNLVGNAVQAVKRRADDERRVTLGIFQDAGVTRFSVTDNGIGIAPEHRQRLFQHGFTTRKDGHGFGLHSGALGARNLGGSLLVESDGLDRGAHFTLELPLHPPKSQS